MRRLLLTSTTTLLAFLLLVAPAWAEWVWPLRGEVITQYRNGDDPYASGQHRGVDIAGDLGAPVVAAVGGEVRFAGVAGSSGLTVSVRTADGRFDTSYLHLASTAVREGDRIGAGARVGTVGTSGVRSAATPHLHFGVRDAGSRHAYHDPLAFLPPPPPAPQAPRVTPAPQPAPVPVAPAPAPVRAPAGRRIPVRAPAPRRVPAPAPGGRRVPVPAPSPRRLPVGAPSPRRVPLGAPSPRRIPVGTPSPRHLPVGAPTPRSAPVGAPNPRNVPVGAPSPRNAPAGAPSPRSTPVGAPSSRHVAAGAPSPGHVPARSPTEGLLALDGRGNRPSLAASQSGADRRSGLGGSQGGPARTAIRSPASEAVPDSSRAGEAANRGPDIGLALACLGLLAAALLLGLTDDGRRKTRRAGDRIARALQPMLGRR